VQFTLLAHASVPFVQQAYIKASDTERSDRFSHAIAVSGLTVVIGAEEERSNATGVNGDQSNNDTSVAGAVYAFKADIVFKDDFE
jgi:hypothetical protein